MMTAVALVLAGQAGLANELSRTLGMPVSGRAPVFTASMGPAGETSFRGSEREVSVTGFVRVDTLGNAQGVLALARKGKLEVLDLNAAGNTFVLQFRGDGTPKAMAEAVRDVWEKRDAFPRKLDYDPAALPKAPGAGWARPDLGGEFFYTRADHVHRVPVTLPELQEVLDLGLKEGATVAQVRSVRSKGHPLVREVVFHFDSTPEGFSDRLTPILATSWGVSVGTKPDFALPDETGKPRSLAEFRGKPVALVFYSGGFASPAG